MHYVGHLPKLLNFTIMLSPFAHVTEFAHLYSKTPIPSVTTYHAALWLRCDWTEMV